MTKREFNTIQHNQKVIRLITEETFGEDIALLEINSSGEGYLITYNDLEPNAYAVAWFKGWKRQDERQFFVTYDKAFALVQSHKDSLEQLALNEKAAKVAHTVLDELKQPCETCGYSLYACVCV